MLRKAKRDSESLAGRLESWAKVAPDPRGHHDRPIALGLYDFFRAQIDQRRQLKSQPMSELSIDERDALNTLDDILDDESPHETVLSRIEARHRSRSTGDAEIDAWYDSLDRGVVPAEFWGPNGPPADYKPPAKAK